MKKIPLKNGMEVLVDDADYDKVKNMSWHHSMGDHNNPRVTTSIPIHRLIMDAPKGKVVDHINGNVLDNRRENLRIASYAENARNSGLRTNNKSGYKGVYWDKNHKRWTARIGVDYRKFHLGQFRTAEEAAGAYNYAAKALHGEFARINPGVEDVAVDLQRIPGHRADSIHPYKGIRPTKSGDRWVAYLSLEIGQVYMGSFETEEQAAAAYNGAAIYFMGDNARLNPGVGVIPYKLPPKDVVGNRLSSTNTSGVVGVSHTKNGERWKANAQIDGKYKYVGVYDTAEEAIQARKEAIDEFSKTRK